MTRARSAASSLGFTCLLWAIALGFSQPAHAQQGVWRVAELDDIATIAAVDGAVEFRLQASPESTRLTTVVASGAESPLLHWTFSSDATARVHLTADGPRLLIGRGSSTEEFVLSERGLERREQAADFGDRPSIHELRVGTPNLGMSEDEMSFDFSDRPSGLHWMFGRVNARSTSGDQIAVRLRRAPSATVSDVLLRYELPASRSNERWFVANVLSWTRLEDVKHKPTPQGARSQLEVQHVDLENDALLAPPGNDQCNGAEVIAGNGPFPALSAVFDSRDATSSGDPVPSCQSDVSRGLWFSFTPSTATQYTFSLCPEDGTGTTVTDTILAIYRADASGCAGALVELAGGCDDDGCAELQSTVRDITLQAGTRYFIVAYNFSSVQPPAGQSSIQLRVSRQSPPGPPPVNDQCSGALAIGGGPFPVISPTTSDVSGATILGDPALPTCQPNVSRSVWYRFRPTVTGTYEIATCSSLAAATTVTDTVIAVFRSTNDLCSGSLTQVTRGCDDNTCTVAADQSLIPSVALDANTNYFIVAHTFGVDPLASDQRAVQLRINRTAGPPANDQCPGAIAIPSSGPFPFLSNVVNDIRDATTTGDPPPPSCQVSVSRSIWYRFVPNTAGRYSFSTCADQGTATTVNDTVVAVYNSADDTCSGAMTQLAGACDDDGCTSESQQAVVPDLSLPAGRPVFVVVHQYGEDPPAASDAAVQLRVQFEGADVDSDGDGRDNAIDCADFDATLWSPPGDPRTLTIAPDKRSLNWQPPTVPGGNTVLYDVLRSSAAADFSSPACAAENLLTPSAIDPTVPASLFAYLVRSENECGLNAGQRSNGVTRSTGDCP